MSTELTLLIVTFVVANLLIMGVVLVFPGDRSSGGGHRGAQGERLPVRYEPARSPEIDRPSGANTESLATYDRILRILWGLTIVGVLAGIGISGAYAETAPFIFAGGAAAAVLTFALHDLAPERWITPLKFALEAIVATALVTALIAATGFGSSPFFFAYYLIAVGVALTLGRRATLLFAGLSGLAYAGVLAFDPRAAEFGAGDLLRFSVNIGSVWLLAYLAAVFAAEERRARAAVLRLSVTDPLTGLFNRGHVYTALEQEIRRTRRSERGFCLLMMDLDGLKAVNDSLGHHRGDEVLRAVAAVISRSIRTVDTAARYGGDEFVVLLPETDRSGAYVVAEKIRAGAEELTYGMVHEHLPTSVSVGLVYHPDDGATVDELMIAADRAMYTSKSLGKNQISGVPDRRTVGRLPALTRSTETRMGTVAVPVRDDTVRSGSDQLRVAEEPPAPPAPPAASAHVITPPTPAVVTPMAPAAPAPFTPATDGADRADGRATAPVETPSVPPAAPAVVPPPVAQRPETRQAAAPMPVTPPADGPHADREMSPAAAEAVAPAADAAAPAPEASMPAGADEPLQAPEREPSPSAETLDAVPPATPEPARAEAITAPDGVVEPRGSAGNSDDADDDFDPAEARRRIAKLSYDPDHQVRRAMDAFLSAPRSSSDDGN